MQSFYFSWNPSIIRVPSLFVNFLAKLDKAHFNKDQIKILIYLFLDPHHQSLNQIECFYLLDFNQLSSLLLDE
jgi:hypothetical protein